MNGIKLYKNLQHYDTVDSTNDFAWKMIKDNPPEEGTVIMADFQLKGRGQRQNTWLSHNKSNITLSIILYPGFLSPEKQFYLSMMLSLAALELLHGNNIKAAIKWPNDIFAKQKKIAGMLIENAITRDTIRHSVLGIGLNVNQLEFDEEIRNATSMKKITKTDYIVDEVVEKFLVITEYWIERLYKKQFGYLKAKYEENLLFRNEKFTFKKDNTLFDGIIQGINENGQLLVADENSSIRPFNFKEIEYCF